MGAFQEMARDMGYLDRRCGHLLGKWESMMDFVDEDSDLSGYRL